MAAAGTTDWTMNGEIGMRILMLEMAGEYDKIYDPATKTYGVDVVEFRAPPSRLRRCAKITPSRIWPTWPARPTATSAICPWLTGCPPN